jgi:pimeloyl-ACP methyl ester carboxylesterase
MNPIHDRTMTTARAPGPTARDESAPVNGLNMHYRIEGAGPPLVFIPGAFGFAGLHAFPALVESHTLITVDLQGHGRTADIPTRPLSIEQHARDVVGLLQHLSIAHADFLGESYGGAAAVWIAVHYPEIVGRVAAYAATYGPRTSAHNTQMLRFDAPPTHDASAFAFQRENFTRLAPDADYWPRIWQKVAAVEWEGFSNEELASIDAPVLIVLGDRDFVRVEHAQETRQRIRHAQLAVIPDAGHFSLLSEQERIIPIVKHFLEAPATRIPVAHAGIGYQPGRTR